MVIPVSSGTSADSETQSNGSLVIWSAKTN